ncbi:MAG TPA: DUF167 domain-containing protein [Thermoleophilaceae bacterium]
MGRLAVRVQPRARRDEIAGERGGSLLVRVRAPPLEGKANAAVCRLLAKRLGLAPGRVAVVRGVSSRDKLVEIEGIEADELRRLLDIGG